MSYQVEKTFHYGAEPKVYKCSLSDALYEAMITKTHGWGHDTSKGIEERLAVALDINARLIEILVNKGIIRPAEIEAVLGLDCTLKGKIVEEPD